jgi:copper chaperone CopZ
MQTHPRFEDLPAYAMGALDHDEVRDIGAHIATCQGCRQVVASYAAVVCLLPYAIEAQAPPGGLKWRLLARVAASEVVESAQGRSMMNEHTNCPVEPVEKPLDEAALANASTVYLAVQGMGCPRCAMRVRNGLLGLDGVLAAEIFLAEGLAVTAYDPIRVAASDLIAAITSAGNDGRHHYQAQVIGQAPTASSLAP